jgi:hypothetical protein
MSNYKVLSNPPIVEQDPPDLSLIRGFGKQDSELDLFLPALITKTASKQTYFTIRYLVDRDRVQDAFRAYAYFRWVDDYLDQKISTRLERIAFVERQLALMNCAYQGKAWRDASVEERILLDLIRSSK